MSLDNFIPEVWSARLFENLKKAHVFPNLANTDYEGEIRQVGDKVRINNIGEISVGNYSKNTDMSSADDLTSSQTELDIDQQKYIHFQIDDIHQAQMKPKVMDAAMTDAGYALADEVDKYIAALHAQAGETLTEDGLTDENIIDELGEASEKLSENNVPQTGRWIVLPPWAIKLLVKGEIISFGASANATGGTIEADASYRAGWVDRAYGFDIYMSNNLAVYDSTGVHALAGTRRAITYAGQISSMEAYRPELRFANAVKGLMVFGSKVVDSNALVNLQIKEG